MTHPLFVGYNYLKKYFETCNHICSFTSNQQNGTKRRYLVY
jgi:hypothetical protein